DVFRQLEPLGQIQVTPEEIRTAQCVPAEIAELAVLRTVAAGTGADARIDDRNKRVRVQPLDRSRLSHVTAWMVFVQWCARYVAGILWAAALNNAISVGGVGRAQNRKWQAAMPEQATRDL